MSENIPSIKAEGLFKSFGNKKVLQDLSLYIDPGTIFGLVGLNGAGKTTLIRILLGLLNPDKGNCSVLGMNPSDHDRDYYRRVGVVLEHNGFFGNLSVLDNLSFFAEARGISCEKMKEYFSQYWKNTDIGKDNRSVKYFSRGQKMQCALCRAFLGWPEIYFLDEPVVALDIEAYDQFCDMVRIAQSKGATVIISSHQLDAIEDLCTSVGILEKGNVNILDTFTGKQKDEMWFIKSEYNDDYKDIIERIAGTPVIYQDGKWQLSISGNTENVISEIISKLVSSGCSIHEVTSGKESFRKSIKDFYNGE
jgi:ABC-2 type transport system ATP-binding protein